jgi:hypothetical protein
MGHREKRMPKVDLAPRAGILRKLAAKIENWQNCSHFSGFGASAVYRSEENASQIIANAEEQEANACTFGQLKTSAY